MGGIKAEEQMDLEFSNFVSNFFPPRNLSAVDHWKTLCFFFLPLAQSEACGKKTAKAKRIRRWRKKIRHEGKFPPSPLPPQLPLPLPYPSRQPDFKEGVFLSFTSFPSVRLGPFGPNLISHGSS